MLQWMDIKFICLGLSGYGSLGLGEGQSFEIRSFWTLFESLVWARVYKRKGVEFLVLIYSSTIKLHKLPCTHRSTSPNTYNTYQCRALSVLPIIQRTYCSSESAEVQFCSHYLDLWIWLMWVGFRYWNNSLSNYFCLWFGATFLSCGLSAWIWFKRKNSFTGRMIYLTTALLCHGAAVLCAIIWVVQNSKSSLSHNSDDCKCSR